MLAAIASACGSGGDNRTEDQRPYQVVTQDYSPGLAADIYLPDGVSAAPVAVLVPGGAWLTADRAGLAPLAQYLAAAGIVAVNTTHRAVQAGGRFPQPVADVVCSVDFAVQRAAEAGIAASTVIVLGHSSGAHLAALAALGGDHFRAAACPYASVHIDALVGLAGTYDVRELEDLAQPLFGTTPTQNPAIWRDGNPLSWVSQRAQPGLDVLLAHGTSDADLPTSFTTEFADALRDGRYAVTVAMIRGATHHTLYSAKVIGPRLVEWVRARTTAASNSKTA